MTNARIILAIAVEADDEPWWHQLEALQAQMFAAGPVNVKLAYFGTESPQQQVRPYLSTRWVNNSEDLLDLIDRARTQCVCGCYVPIGDILDHALQEESVQAVVIVSDRFYGRQDALVAKAKELAAAGTRLFVFQQQGASTASEHAFRSLTEATNGAFFRFNPHVERVAQRLPRMVEAITHFALGGLPALQAQDNEAAGMLLEQMTTTKLPGQ
jgi:hypothetical protein